MRSAREAAASRRLPRARPGHRDIRPSGRHGLRRAALARRAKRDSSGWRRGSGRRTGAFERQQDELAASFADRIAAATPSCGARSAPSSRRPKRSDRRSPTGLPSSRTGSTRPGACATADSSRTNKTRRPPTLRDRPLEHEQNAHHDRCNGADRPAQRAGQGRVLAAARLDRGRLPPPTGGEARGCARRRPTRRGRARRPGLRPEGRHGDPAAPSGRSSTLGRNEGRAPAVRRTEGLHRRRLQPRRRRVARNACPPSGSRAR